MTAESLVIATKPPFHLKIGDYKVDFQSGCSAIDISFPNIFYVEVGEIHFKNYYTAWVSLQARVREQGTDDMGRWKTCVPRLQLMPQPHSEAGAEDYFMITTKQMQFELRNVTGLRLILRQPSPMWKDFRLEDIKVYKTSIQAPANVPLPDWVMQPKSPMKQLHREIKGIGSMDKLSGQMQQMWATVEQARTEQTKTSLGRYDVDGSYEINLLSYT